MLIPLCFKNFHQLTRKCCLIAATVGVIIFSRCVCRQPYVFNSLRDTRRLKRNGGVFKNLMILLVKSIK